jgi:hypothetical protein
LEGETYEAKAAEKEAKRADRLKEKRGQRAEPKGGDTAAKAKGVKEEEAGFSVFGFSLW